MDYRITYKQKTAAVSETIIVSSIVALHALIDYANKWDDTIERIEERESRARSWKPSTISQYD